ncbi:MAG: glutathione ABC transporter substrate-binding protein GsiB, partial [Budvicia sp.]|nr:glutathione ABC transporter substrate-binding protein GsiB [Budvicia sp.]
MSKLTLPRKTLLAAGIVTLASFSAMPAFADKDVVIAVSSNFTTLDPYDANDTLSQAVSKSFYQGMFGFNKDAKLVNVLAESYDVSPDGLEYTFKLRQGVKFHDGTDFNADAVKASFDRVTNPENHLKRFNMFNRIAKTEVIDPYTVKMTLRAPYSAFINSLAHPAAVIMSPTALQKYGKDIAFHPVGTGPFQFAEWNATDYMKVKKFDNYWKKDLPKVDSITWRPVVENNTRAAMMQTGEAHFAYPIPYEQAKLLEKNPKLEMVSAPSIIQRYISFNVTQKPFDDVRVRQAINYAINKEALAKVAFAGYANLAEGVVPKGVDFATSYG